MSAGLIPADKESRLPASSTSSHTTNHNAGSLHVNFVLAQHWLILWRTSNRRYDRKELQSQSCQIFDMFYCKTKTWSTVPATLLSIPNSLPHKHTNTPVMHRCTPVHASIVLMWVWCCLLWLCERESFYTLLSTMVNTDRPTHAGIIWETCVNNCLLNNTKHTGNMSSEHTPNTPHKQHCYNRKHNNTKNRGATKIIFVKTDERMSHVTHSIHL